MDKINGGDVLSNALRVKFCKRRDLSDDDIFKICRETLDRMGIVTNGRKKELQLVCHIFTLQGSVYILHWKELRRLYHCQTEEMLPSDYLARDIIVKMMCNWNLIEIDDQSGGIIIDQDGKNWAVPIKVLSNIEKWEWTIVSKIV